MEIEAHLRAHVPKGWESVFEDAEYGHNACKYLRKKKIDYVPRTEDVFRAFELIEPKDVKVVIVGQDPYYTPHMADGLSFSTRNGNIPPSLRNIFKELSNTIDNFEIPDHGSLVDWTRQGILLLNTSLTAKEGASGDHPGIWMDVIEATVAHLTNINPRIIWVMWGAKAQKLSKLILDKGIKLTAAHPSPVNTGGGFLGCDFANKINKILIDRNEQPIDWRIN